MSPIIVMRTGGFPDIGSMVKESSRRALPLEHESHLDPLMEEIGDSRFVLLGEASHGTSEYYVWPAALSRRLIEEKAFSFVAVEGDWPDCYRVNQYVKGVGGAGSAVPGSARDVLHAFDRWPTWMWANWEVVAFAEWLKRRNARSESAAGFYGLDVYSLWDSLRAVMQYLERNDGSALDAARRAFRCFQPYSEDVQQFARASAFVPELCEEEVIGMLASIRARAPALQEEDPEAYFAAEQNALVARNAERYYKAMVRGGPSSWNVRDIHMVDTLDRLMEHHGPEAKAIVWEHNTHVGDARATNMAQAGMVNVGQLVRERHADAGVYIVGFGSWEGSVIAGYEWGYPMQRMPVPPAREGSWEQILHEACGADCLVLLRGLTQDPAFSEPRGHRAIGVVYDPEYERFGNYVPTRLPQRYDAFLFIDRSRALHPLHLAPYDTAEPPDTYPWSF